MSPKGQAVAALAVMAPVALSGIFLVAFVPELWWIFTTYFWVAFPSLGLLARFPSMNIHTRDRKVRVDAVSGSKQGRLEHQAR